MDIADLSDDINNGMTSCRANNCLYVNDYDNDTVYRVDVIGDKTVLSTWEVGSNPMGLSVNAARNVLVTCHWAKKLQEFTPNGILIREIRVQGMPVHAIELNNGHFLVSLPVLRDVVEINSEGRTIVSYSKEVKSSFGQLFTFVRHMTVEKDEELVCVASWSHDTLVAVNRPSRRTQLVYASPDSGEVLRKPRCLYLDESIGRLYAGEGRTAGSRLFWFDIRHHCLGV